MASELATKINRIYKKLFWLGNNEDSRAEHSRLLRETNSKVSRLTEEIAELKAHATTWRIENLERLANGLEVLLASRDFAGGIDGAPDIRNSRSQISQDIFVLAELKNKRGGYFVDFGATNGVDLSNSYLLEKHYGWNGILAEPARCWHEDLRKNRSAAIDTRCVWSETGHKLEFNETKVPELSTISKFNDVDDHRRARSYGETYEVETVSLTDLLDHYRAPREIDYLSIDTEGSEFEILSNFDFSKYRFSVITCEHNFTEMRERMNYLLTSHGYKRKHEALSRWDDWYVSA
jgi:FkbM family methyltransferase